LPGDGELLRGLGNRQQLGDRSGVDAAVELVGRQHLERVHLVAGREDDRQRGDGGLPEVVRSMVKISSTRPPCTARAAVPA
jgi:hypothetical protein